jgi:hypothetical protein
VQVFLVRLGQNTVDMTLAQNIMELVTEIFNYHKKVISAGLLIIHGLINNIEENTVSFMHMIKEFLKAALKPSSNDDDEKVCRFACGLISDLSNFLQDKMTPYLQDFMELLNAIMSKSEYQTETKLFAITAVGDICLAVEDQFHSYLESTMECLNSAAMMSLQPVNERDEDMKELITNLKAAIIDSYISIAHGMHGLHDNQDALPKL